MKKKNLDQNLDHAAGVGQKFGSEFGSKFNFWITTAGDGLIASNKRISF